MQGNRDRIIEAAARIYAQHGYRGATTRRIADEAGVNEITVFRHFGSKSALLDSVVQECGIADKAPPLPSKPVDPQAELTAWIQARMDHTRAIRLLILQTMSELQERPDMGPCVGHGPVDAANQLRDYVVRLRRHGMLDTRPGMGLKPLEVNAAVAMLMNAYFGDAMSRQMMPDMFPSPAEKAAAAYVRVFLRAIGFRAHENGTSDPSPDEASTRTVRHGASASSSL
jgi:AcrR family transcriptional regulator